MRFVEPDQRDLGSPVLFAKIFPFTADPNQLYIPPSCPTEGRIAIVTDAGRDAVDAAAFCARWMAGRVGERPVSDHLSEQTNDADAYGKIVWS